MGTEIERKFLVVADGWRTKQPLLLRQGYLNLDPERCVRVRTNGRQGFLTIKGISVGATRAEYEYPIPLEEANEMLDRLCLRPIIEKYRHVVKHGDHTWEVDQFLGENDGLIVAEIELQDESENWAPPSWIGKEVTTDMRYQNVNLVEQPYNVWDPATR